MLGALKPGSLGHPQGLENTAGILLRVSPSLALRPRGAPKTYCSSGGSLAVHEQATVITTIPNCCARLSSAPNDSSWTPDFSETEKTLHLFVQQIATRLPMEERHDELLEAVRPR